MKLDEKDLAFIQELTTAPQRNITLYTILRGSGSKPYYGCILYPSLQVDVTPTYATLQEASDATKQEAEQQGSHPWSTLYILSDFFNPVLVALKQAPDPKEQ